MTKTAASPPDPVEAAVTSIAALLASIDRSPSPPATVAFKAAIRRNGVNLRDAAGLDALAAVRARIRDEAPDQAAAQDRDRILAEAWADLLSTKDRAA